MVKLDWIDCEILNILQVNCRASLTEISEKVNLSIDSVNKRIKKMLDNKIFWPKIQIRPRNFGYNNIVDVKIRVQYTSKEKIEKFLNHLINHPRVVEIFSVSGDWDYSIVIIAKNAIDLGNITREIRLKFGEMIRSWTESLTTNSFKFEYYDMCQLFDNEPKNVKFPYEIE